MFLILKSKKPLREDKTEAIKEGNSRVLPEIVIWAFQDGTSLETIANRYSTLILSDTYEAIAKYS